MRSDNTKLAIIYALIAAFFYAVMGLLVKVAEQSLTNEMVVFFRQLTSLIVFAPIFYLRKEPATKLKSQQFPLHLLRAFASISASYCLFYALEYLPLVDALLLSYTHPLFLPIVAFFWLGKRWHKGVWYGLLTGFLGVILILKPSQRVFDIAALVGLAAGLFGAVAFSAIRRLTKHEEANKILFIYLLISLPITSIPMISSWVNFSWPELGLLVLVGLAGMIYQMVLTRAYRHAKAYKVGSVLYSTVIFATLFDWFMGGKFLDVVSMIGIVLIFLGSFATLRATKES